MQLSLIDNLPFATITVAYMGNAIDINNVLIDTGSGTTILAADIVSSIQITPSPKDTLYTIRGVGGNEVVFSRQVDCLKMNDRSISDFEIEIGGMDYGFEINGVLGMDFLIRAGAIINLRDLEIRFAD